MALTYSEWVDQFANLLVETSTGANFQTFLPGAIDYAEQRLYRELDLLGTIEVDTSTTFSSGVRSLTLPSSSNPYLVVDSINAIYPAGTTVANGTRYPLTLVSPDYIYSVYPSASVVTGVPEFWARLSADEILVGPAPEGAYVAEITGTKRPAPLSATNTETILTLYFPDLFMAASMIFGTGYQRNFGAQSDDPRASQSWQAQYDSLIKSAMVEEVRKKFAGAAWTSQSPSPVAQPPRV